ncbi:MAG TPA: hypothetical protein VFW69_24460 [Mycobacterium sp.]|nr:hypothetical protein [Mycobacterium sp.]
MRSINVEKIEADYDALCAVVARFQKHSYEALTFSELVEVLEDYEFLIGWLDAFKYELGSPFTLPSGRRT